VTCAGAEVVVVTVFVAVTAVGFANGRCRLAVIGHAARDDPVDVFIVGTVQADADGAAGEYRRDNERRQFPGR